MFPFSKVTKSKLTMPGMYTGLWNGYCHKTLAGFSFDLELEIRGLGQTRSKVKKGLSYAHTGLLTKEHCHASGFVLRINDPELGSLYYQLQPKLYADSKQLLLKLESGVYSE